MTLSSRTVLFVAVTTMLCVVLALLVYMDGPTRMSPMVVTNGIVASTSNPITEVSVETDTSTSIPLSTEPPSEPAPNLVKAPIPPSPETPATTPQRAGTSSISTVPSSTITPDVPTPLTWKEAIATVFWVGEGESEDNSYIHNRASAWDEDWVGTFGGVDDPDDRCGFAPCGFTPQQSPFYVALPYLEYLYDGYKKNAQDIPWYTKDALVADTLVHGHWVAVRNGSTVCYGQWRDTGPFETDDFAYVFGTATVPRNTEGVGAGIDLSPAMRDCLGVGDVSRVVWRFVDEDAVPVGPWRDGGSATARL